MALPILNDTLKYELVIPSTKKRVEYRPYLVKEEKILLQAFETKDEKVAMKVMVETVIACTTEQINADELTTYDVEFMFSRIRAKSVGETTELAGNCKSEDCNAITDLTVDILSSEVNTDIGLSNKVSLTDDISIELRHPSYTSFMKHFDSEISESDYGMLMIEECVAAVTTPDERITEWTQQEMSAFINSMTNKQFTQVGQFLEAVPKLKKDLEWKCIKCGHENKITLEGLQDFF